MPKPGAYLKKNSIIILYGEGSDIATSVAVAVLTNKSVCSWSSNFKIKKYIKIWIKCKNHSLSFERVAANFYANMHEITTDWHELKKLEKRSVQCA